jgi:predicted nuclease with TOPRIM domain
LSEDLRRIEEAVERAVRRALAEARTEDLRILAEAVKTLADYVREGFKLFNERFEGVDKRLSSLEMRLSSLEKRSSSLENEVKRLKSDIRYLTSAVNELKSALGVTMEDYTAVWLSRWLEEKGYKCDVRTRITIVVNPLTGDSREVNVICWNPLVVGEVTTTIRTVEEAEREIRKLLDSVAYAEKAAGAKHYAKILAVEVAPSEIAEYLERRARELDITLVLGRRY